MGWRLHIIHSLSHQRALGRSPRATGTYCCCYIESLFRDCLRAKDSDGAAAAHCPLYYVRVAPAGLERTRRWILRHCIERGGSSYTRTKERLTHFRSRKTGGRQVLQRDIAAGGRGEDFYYSQYNLIIPPLAAGFVRGGDTFT